MQKKIVFALILSVLIAVFAISNAINVSVNLIFVTANISAALVILISASIGAMIVYLIGAVSRYKLKKLCKDLEVSMTSLNREVSRLTEKNKQLKLEINHQEAKNWS